MNAQPKHIEIILGDKNPKGHDLFTEAVNHLGIPAILSSFDSCGKLTQFLDRITGSVPVPDVIFMDIDLSAKNGKACLREVRETPRYEKIPIIVFASSFTPVDVQESRKFGANLYINKPTGLKELIDLLQKIFSPRWQRVLSNS
jgi:CheY-like chemotaxis protein